MLLSGLFTLFVLQHTLAQQILINEILASNKSVSLDDLGNYSDWVELFNFGSSSVNIGGYFLTDDLTIPLKWEIPTGTSIAAGGFLLIRADGQNTGLHTNFNLSRDGESIGIFNSNGLVVDTISFGYQSEDVSFGRSSANISHWIYFITPSPGAENAASGTDGITSDPIFSLSGGFYSGSQQLVFSTGIEDAEIFYTTDGTEPDTSSFLYSSPIVIDTCTPIRALVFKSGLLPGRIITNTYFIDETITLPVISIVTDPDNFFDDKIGIYVTGTNGIRGDCDPTIRNLNQDWERPVNIEMYETNGTQVINQLAGIKIFGGCSRTRFPQKSLALYARSEYGKGSFDYRLFPDKPIDKFEAFLLRSSADDQVYTMFRDALAQKLLVEYMDADYQAYRPAVVFLNGVYWGIHNIREKINEHYLEENFGVDPDDINLLEENAYVSIGSNAGYTNLINFVMNNNMSSSSNYEYVKTQMDVNQYIDYQIGHIYLAERDWPGNNIKYWKANSGNYSKWRWINYDMDQCLTDDWIAENMIEKATAANGPSWPNPEWSTRLLRRLLLNTEFKNEFIQRYAWHMNVSFNPQRIIEMVNSMSTAIEQEIPRHITKWGGQLDPDFNEGWPILPTFDTFEKWQANVDTMRIFAVERPAYTLSHFIQKFGLSGTSEVTLNLDTVSAGQLKIVDRQVPAGFSGTFFNDVPLKIRAIPNLGYSFSHWKAERNSQTTNHIISTGSDWKYFDSGSDLGNEWISESYDDSGWPSGQAQLGYGDGDENTTISYGPDSQNKHITTYFRRSFNISAAAAISSLYCDILVDDGAVAYLNGNEIARINMPQGSITYLTTANGNIADENAYTTIQINPALLIEGNNILTVEIHQYNGTSSDLSFDFSLTGYSNQNLDSLIYNTPEIEITLSSGITLTAYFDKDTTAQTIPVVINEINYKSSSVFDSGDWIELYNYSNAIVDVSNWKFKDSGNNTAFEFPNNLLLNPDSYLVLCEDTSKFDSYYPEINNRIGEFQFGLSSDGEMVTLLNPSSEIIDEVSFSNINPWPENTNGTGYTIELKNFTFDNNDGSSWATSGDLHGSPGKTNNIISNVENINRMPEKYALEQNHPNPFNPSTTISYQLSKAGYVEINIYNIMGQRVTQLISDNQESGNYSITWDAQNFASGIYFYRIRSGEFNDVKKMILMK